MSDEEMDRIIKENVFGPAAAPPRRKPLEAAVVTSAGRVKDQINKVSKAIHKARRKLDVDEYASFLAWLHLESNNKIDDYTFGDDHMNCQGAD